jgi:flavin-binding protein dodecin
MSMHVYKTIELTGSSKINAEDAITGALALASKTICNMQ